MYFQHKFLKFSAFVLFTALSIFSTPAFADTLSVITSFDSLEAKEYIETFQKETGIKVQWVRLPAGEALARIKSEAKNPTNDVWFGGPVSEYVAAANVGLLEKNISRAISLIPPVYRDSQNYWTGISFGAIVFISGKNVRPPKSWADLISGDFKNEIVVSYPYTAGTGFTVLSGLVAMMGEDAAMAYYKKLDAQIRRYTKSGATPIVEVGLGEAGVGIVFDQDALRKGVSRGFPIQISYPEDGIPYEVAGAAIMRGRATPEAKRFVDWIVSANAQNLMQKWYRIPLYPNAKLNPMSKKPSELPLAKIDFATAGRDRERLVKKWRETIGK